MRKRISKKRRRRELKGVITLDTLLRNEKKTSSRFEEEERSDGRKMNLKNEQHMCGVVFVNRFRVPFIILCLEKLKEIFSSSFLFCLSLKVDTKDDLCIFHDAQFASSVDNKSIILYSPVVHKIFLSFFTRTNLVAWGCFLCRFIPGDIWFSLR